MKIINVIELASGEILNVTSFIIKNKKTEEQVIGKVKEYFISLVKENSLDLTESDIESYYEDCLYTNIDGYEVNICTSTIR